MAGKQINKHTFITSNKSNHTQTQLACTVMLGCSTCGTYWSMHEACSCTLYSRGWRTNSLTWSSQSMHDKCTALAHSSALSTLQGIEQSLLPKAG